MEAKSWTVVKFIDEDTVEAIPTSWIVGHKCYWPSYVSEKIRIAIRNYEHPNTCWQMHRISVFRNATFETYREALAKSRIAEYKSDLTDIDESRENRKTRKKKAMTSSSSDEFSQEELNLSQLPIRNKKENNEKANCIKQIESKSQSLMVPEDDTRENDLYASQIQQAKRKTTETVEKVDRMEQIKQTSQLILPDENPDILIEEVFVDGEPFELGVYQNSKDCRCCPVHHNDTKKILENIATVLDNCRILIKKDNLIVSMISEHFDQMKKLIEKIDGIRLQSPINDEASVCESFLNKFDFPLATKEQFVDFDEFLKDENNFKAVVSELAKIGGNGAYDYVRRVLSLLLKNCLAMQFTWLGTKDKNSLHSTKIAAVLLKSIQSTAFFIDQKNSEEAIKKYLRRSRERNAYEKK